MNHDPFLRLALIASVSAYAVAIAVVWGELGWPAGLAGILCGPLGAAALTIEQRDEPTERPDPRRHRRGPRP